MIIRIHSAGKSFKGLATYLTRDPKAKTDERVGWTHTLNLANDHVGSAVDEMVWTARHAELLKQQTGSRAGGRATENTVKHFSLNWSPEDDPSREEMISATEAFLRHMDWHSHQVLLVAHRDKDHAHVHGMLNTIHPETGLKLNEDFERRRAQQWALAYEKEHGRIYCEQRLMDVEDREAAPTRPAWMAFKENQQKFENAEKTHEARNAEISRDPEKPENIADDEWKILKDMQRHERQGFFAGGKSAFAEARRAVFREVREEFRERWSELYAAQRDGSDPDAIAEMKQRLLDEQKTILDGRRDDACKALRESRDRTYRELLDEQGDIRQSLRNRQEAEFENALFLEWVEKRSGDFSRAADAVTGHQSYANGPQAAAVAPEAEARPAPQAEVRPAPVGDAKPPRTGARPAADIGVNVASGLAFSLFSFAESLVDGFVGAKPAEPARQEKPTPEASDSNPFAVAAAQAKRDEERRSQEERERDWRRRQQSNEGE